MIRTVFFPHVAAAILVTGIILLIYASVQQQYRTSANDPQIQVARDIAAKLKQNKPVGTVIPADTVDLEQSLSTFVQVYDDKNDVLQSTGFAGGKVPVVPAGVLGKAKAEGENTVTWQPSASVRLASVIVYTGAAPGAYVLVGRSLWEVEKRESALVKMVFMCWLLCMSVICAHGLLQAYLAKKEKANR